MGPTRPARNAKEPRAGSAARPLALREATPTAAWNSPQRAPASSLTRTAGRLSNGKQLFLTVANGALSQNSIWVRRLKDLIADHCAGLGGTELLSVSQLFWTGPAPVY